MGFTCDRVTLLGFKYISGFPSTARSLVLSMTSLCDGAFTGCTDDTSTNTLTATLVGIVSGARSGKVKCTTFNSRDSNTGTFSGGTAGPRGGGTAGTLGGGTARPQDGTAGPRGGGTAGFVSFTIAGPWGGTIVGPWGGTISCTRFGTKVNFSPIGPRCDITVGPCGSITVGPCGGTTV